jgi:hypothetical protein
MMGAASSQPDPFGLQSPGELQANVSGSWHDTAGRTQVSPALVGGQNTVLLICYGQSLIANADDDNAYSTVSSLSQQFCVDNGGVYVAANPNMGASYTTEATPKSSYLTRLGDKLIADGYCARVIVANVSVGGTLIADWASGGKFNARLRVVAQRLVKAGLVPANLYKTFILQHQGESWDAVTAAAYTASTLSAIGTITGASGFSCSESLRRTCHLQRWLDKCDDSNRPNQCCEWNDDLPGPRS